MPNRDTPAPETPVDRRARQLAYFRRLADLNMRAAEIAAEQLETAHASGEPGATASPTQDLGRATRAVTTAVNAENAVIAGKVLRARPNDRRRAPLRDALHTAAKAEPDPAARAAMRRDIDERIEEVLATDPDAEIELHIHFFGLAEEFDLDLDLANLPDELLGTPPEAGAPHSRSPPEHN